LKHLLISMGSMDTENATGKVLEALEMTELSPECRITVVLGAKAPHLEEVRRQVLISRRECRVNVDEENMASLMADSDLSIGSAGTSSWERCTVGLPSILVILASNQIKTAHALKNAEAAYIIDNVKCINSLLPQFIKSAVRMRTLHKMSDSSQSICDGKGIDRVLKTISEMEFAGVRKKMSCSIRIMQEKDLDLILTWRNDPSVRNYMFNKRLISKEEHREWYVRNQRDENSYLLIAEENSKPIGFVNFRKFDSGEVAEWGFYAVPNSPKGSGRKVAITALDYAFSELRFHKVCGQVLVYNSGSINLHQALGFTDEGILRKQHYDGEKYHDVRCFGLLASEWKIRPTGA